jgi:hypothetical protein
MSEIPPSQFAAYPRPGLDSYGSAAKLKALADCYFGMTQVFVLTAVLNISLRVVAIAVSLTAYFVLMLLALVVIVGFSWTKVDRLAFGMDWEKSKTIGVKALMILNFFCCAIVGMFWLQSIAGQEMKKYGLRGGFFGFKKRIVNERISQLNVGDV